MPTKRRDDDPVKVTGPSSRGYYRITYWPTGVPGIGTRQERSGGRDRVAAEELAAEIRAHIVGGAGGDAPRFDATFGEVAQLWVDAHRDTWTDGTLKGYRRDLNCYILPALTAVPVRSLGVPHLAAVCDAVTGAGLSKHTLNGAIRTLSSLTSWAQLRHHLPAGAFGDPVQQSAVKAAARRRYRDSDDKISVDQVPSHDDVAELAAEMQTRYERGSALVYLLAGTGLRYGEALGLRGTDIDLDAGTIAVDRQMLSTRPFPATGPPKGGRPRVALPWDSHIEHWAAAAADAGDEFVFAPDIAQFGTRGLWWHLRLAERFTAGRRQLGWHTRGWGTHWLRHHYISWSLAPVTAGGYGIPAPVVSAAVGHKDAAQTLGTYNQSTGDAAATVRALTTR
jgi:integrase